MDEFEGERKSNNPLRELMTEDLDSLSVDELKDRVAALRSEIERAETKIAAKSASRSAAEAVFKS